jgi:hypothetical protein
VADLNLQKAADSIADLLAAYVNQFLGVVTKPRSTFKTIFGDVDTSSRRLRNALAYTAVTILLGAALARFVGLKNSPTEISPQTALAVLLIWVMAGLLLHPFLRLIGAKSDIQATVTAALYVVATLHIPFVLILGILSRTITDTRVVLTYEYAVYFAVRLGSGGSIGNWRENLQEFRSESFLKERNPAKDRTILPPAPPRDSFRDFTEVPRGPEQRTRVPLGSGGLQAPHRTESPEVRTEYGLLLWMLWCAYYIVTAIYLATGLAVAHRMSALFLLGAALLTPLFVIAGTVLTVIYLL